MKKVLTFILMLITLYVSGQKDISKITHKIVAEGKILYKSEMASWNGTDIFIEKYKNKENISGYFSYLEKDFAICIFFSKGENPKVIGTISFDSTFNVNKAKIDLTERDFTKLELDLFLMRKIVIDDMTTNADGFYKFYQNTNPNIIPLIDGKERKVYILTGPQKSGIIIFGNDYLITFDKKLKIVARKQLHKNIIPFEYGNKDQKGEEAIHSHLPETGDFITATDICTLMLYSKYAKWKTHNVISKKYLNIWNCDTNTLTVIPKNTVDKIIKDQEKRQKKN